MIENSIILMILQKLKSKSLLYINSIMQSIVTKNEINLHSILSLLEIIQLNFQKVISSIQWLRTEEEKKNLQHLFIILLLEILLEICMITNSNYIVFIDKD